MRKCLVSAVTGGRFVSRCLGMRYRPLVLQVYLMRELLQPIQYARAEVCAFPAMHDGIKVGELALARCRQDAGCRADPASCCAGDGAAPG